MNQELSQLNQIYLLIKNKNYLNILLAIGIIIIISVSDNFNNSLVDLFDNRIYK